MGVSSNKIRKPFLEENWMIPGREKQQMCTVGTAGRGGEGEGSGADDLAFFYTSAIPQPWSAPAPLGLMSPV